MKPSSRCVTCLRPLPPGVPAGICPECAFDGALDAGCLVGRTLAGYEILEEIGRGGMGAVYKARQVRLNRVVAIKVPVAGQLANADELRRFKAEAETVARFDHPSIVAVHEVVEEGGHTFFSMALVDGTNLAEGLQAGVYHPVDAAKLLVTLAEAVHYAHQHGVLHGDLKPSNVLIDRDGRPHLTDFGLARLFEDSTAEVRRTRAIAGSPAYMAPEQVAENGLLTVAVDVHGLGAILYELLTGRPPFHGKTPMEVLRQVAETEPVPPRRVGAKIDRDIETICLKCLAKDPAGRYASAALVEQDLARWLDREPILARPAGAMERLWRWCQRKPLLASMGAAVVLAVLAGLGQAVRATRAEVQAKLDQQRAMVEAAKSMQTTKFLSEMLQGITPEQAQGRDTQLIEEILNQTARRVDAELAGYPEVEATVRDILTDTNLRLGRYAEAQKQGELALDIRLRVQGPSHFHTHVSMFELASVHLALRNLAEAERLLRWALEAGAAVRKPEDPLLLNIMAALAHVLSGRGQHAEAELLYRRVMESQGRVLGANHPDTLKTMNGFAIDYRLRGQLGEAEKLLEAVLAAQLRTLGPDHFEIWPATYNLATLAYSRGHVDQAVESFRKVLAAYRRLYGTEHSQTLKVMSGLAAVLQTQGKAAEAQSLLDDALKLQRRILGTEHVETLATLENQANGLIRAGQLSEAERLLRQVVETQKKTLGLAHGETLRAVNNLGRVLALQNKLSEAEFSFLTVLDAVSRAWGPEHPLALAARNNVAAVFLSQGKLPQAEVMSRQSMEAMEGILGPEHRDTLTAMTGLANIFVKAGKIAEAEHLYRRALEGQQRKLGPKHPDTLLTTQRLMNIYLSQDRFVEAEPFVRQRLQLEREKKPAVTEGVLNWSSNLGLFLAEWAWSDWTNAVAHGAAQPATTSPLERAREAETLLQECLTLQSSRTNESRRRVADLQNRLGFAQVAIVVADPAESSPKRLERLAELERVLIGSVTALQAQPDASRPLQEAIQRLLHLYEAWDAVGPDAGKAVAAARWRATLQSLERPGGSP